MIGIISNVPSGNMGLSNLWVALAPTLARNIFRVFKMRLSVVDSAYIYRQV
jgi:hypothetical protein